MIDSKYSTIVVTVVGLYGGDRPSVMLIAVCINSLLSVNITEQSLTLESSV